MARKKAIFVIVEGDSEDTALSGILSNHFNKNFVNTIVIHNDITAAFDKDTHKKVGVADITKKIAEVVRRQADSFKLKSEDIERIIHIVDTDGAFVSENHVIQSNVDSPVYTLKKIFCPIRGNIIERNSRKAKNLLRLANTPTIWKIPYNIYYMSCNLDHVLYNNQNSNDKDKELDATFFALRYKKKHSGIHQLCFKI